MEQEKDLLQGQVTWLNKELKAKSEELLSLSRQRGSEILELQCSLNNRDEKVHHYPTVFTAYFISSSTPKYIFNMLVHVLIFLCPFRSPDSKIR